MWLKYCNSSFVALALFYFYFFLNLLLICRPINLKTYVSILLSFRTAIVLKCSSLSRQPCCPVRIVYDVFLYQRIRDWRSDWLKMSVIFATHYFQNIDRQWRWIAISVPKWRLETIHSLRQSVSIRTNALPVGLHIAYCSWEPARSPCGKSICCL